MSTFIEEAKTAILESSTSSSIYVGCDSKRFKKKDGRWFARYVTVIILHKDSSKGCVMFHETNNLEEYEGAGKNPKRRLLNEVMFAVNAAYEIMPVIGDRHWELHVDINPNPRYKSNAAVKEALGYVRGNLGIDAKIKPEAWAASTTADHMVNG